MACGKIFAIILILAGVTIVGSAIATVAFPIYLINPTPGPIIFDPAWSAVLVSNYLTDEINNCKHYISTSSIIQMEYHYRSSYS